MSKARFFRFCYPSNQPQGRPRYPHQLRDGDAAVELMPALASLGFEYGGVFINWRRSPAEDTSRSDFEALHLTESDILLLTTRPPIDDKARAIHPLRKSGTALEKDIFSMLGQKCLKTCSRKEIVLQESLAQLLPDAYQDRSAITYEVMGQEASYKNVEGGELRQRYAAWSAETSSGYMIHLPLGADRPRLLTIFSLSGTMTLLWAYRLGKLRDVLDRALSVPSFTLGEMVRTGPIPSEKGWPQATFDFCLNWELKIVGPCKL